MDRPFTRQQLIRGAAGGAVTLGVGGLLSGCGGGEPAASAPPDYGSEVGDFDDAVQEAFGTGDLGIANYALTLEHLEADYYTRVVDSGLLSGSELQIATDVRDNEREHVEALTALIKELDGDPVKAPRTEFPLRSREQVLELAADLENLGAAAYLGQAYRIQDRKVLASALSIHTVEAAHAAVLNMLVDRTITPDGSVGSPLGAGAVLEEANRYIVES